MAQRMTDQQRLDAIRDVDPELWAELGEDLAAPRPEIAFRALRGATGAVGAPEPDLTPETIVLAKGRPVLAIAKDTAVIQLGPGDSKTWTKRLQTAQPRLTPAIQAIGRIEVQGHDQLDWLGTGWLIGPDVVATNRHVATEFARASAGGFVFRTSIAGGPMSASIDFIEEIGRDDSSQTFSVAQVIHIEDDSGPDMALLRVSSPNGGTAIPLYTDASPAEWVAVVGYPARDTRIVDQKLMDRLFGEVYDSKRLAPGRVTGTQNGLVLHDCTTLGGNSGSPVLDLGSGRVVALHFAGRYKETNYAVPAPVLADMHDRVMRGESRRTYSVPAAGTTSPQPAVTSSMVAPGRVIRATIPIHITVEIDAPLSGSPGGSGGSSGPPAGPPSKGQSGPAGHGAPDNEPIVESAKPEDYKGRKGYLEGFLKTKVPLPGVVAGKGDVLKFSTGASKTDTVLRYQNFSVVMSAKRRMCFFSAVNINGKLSKKYPRTGWRTDPRIPIGAQIKGECYGNPPRFSRGHMTRREDPVWGPDADAQRGNDDSMHVTNAVPQMQSFNGSIWLSLEDYALQNAREDGMKISVMTGPIFDDNNDPVKYGVKIPIAFWKVIAFIHDDTGNLSATGYSISQDDYLEVPEFVYGKFKTFQRSLKWIEAQTGLTFGSLTKTDRFKEFELGVPRALLDPSQILW